MPRSSFYIVPWQMLCRAAIVPHQFFWGREESQKISTCDFNTSVPPCSTAQCFILCIPVLQSTEFWSGAENVGERHCLCLNNGEVFLWLGKVLIGRYEKDCWLLKKPRGNWLLSVSPFCVFSLCLCPPLPLCNTLKRSQFSFKLGPGFQFPSAWSQCGYAEKREMWAVYRETSSLYGVWCVFRYVCI